MKILFIARHFTYMRNFDAVLEELARRGHHVHVAVEQQEEFGGVTLIERLTRDFPGRITAGLAPFTDDRRYRLAVKLRFAIDYLRYLDPPYARMPRLGERARKRAPLAALWLTARWPFTTHAGRRLLGRLMSAIEQAMPRDPAIVTFLHEQQPDAVLFTPLIGVVASPQPDYLYAARAMTLPTALCVWSWDHLSSKAIIRTVPDRVIVWNPTQEREARELHGVPRERIVVTGAQCFDRWFDRRPSRPREDFCRRVGLPHDGPFLLWVCSALFKGSPVEAEFVLRWVRALRDSGHHELRDVSILVRPHPSRLPEWAGVDASALERVAIWGSNPVDAEPRADYFDSLSYSTAIAGLNTSAFIEGAIAGRPVYTILLPEYFENQEGTIHFHYLLGGSRVSGPGFQDTRHPTPDTFEGLLHASRSFEEHAAHLAAALRGDADAGRSRRFVEAFVRPYGWDQPATPRFVETIEHLPAAAAGRAPAGAGLAPRLAAALFMRVAATETGSVAMLDEHGAAKARRRREAASRKRAEQAASRKRAEQAASRKRAEQAPSRERTSRTATGTGKASAKPSSKESARAAS